jgi:DIM1 family U5 snRNP protein
MKMDETLYGVAERVKNFAVIYLVDVSEVPDFNKVKLSSCVIRFLALFSHLTLFNRCMNCTILVHSCSSTETSIL